MSLIEREGAVTVEHIELALPLENCLHPLPVPSKMNIQ
jgi:hypothetical protein